MRPDFPSCRDDPGGNRDAANRGTVEDKRESSVVCGTPLGAGGHKSEEKRREKHPERLHGVNL